MRYSPCTMTSRLATCIILAATQTADFAHGEGVAPDGGYLLAVVTDRFSNRGELTFLDINGNRAGEFAKSMRGGHPAWSPDGEWIAVEHSDENGSNIVVFSADGSQQRSVIGDDHENYWPTWSPDGNRIAFLSVRDGHTHIAVANVDGSNVQVLTDHTGLNADPAWRPGSEEVVFISDRSGLMRLHALNVAENTVRPFLETPLSGWALPSFSPDGAMVAFGNQNQIFVSDAAGKTVRQISTGAGQFRMATWSPDGRYITYCRVQEEPGGNADLVLFDVLHETQTTLLPAALPPNGERVAWRPLAWPSP